MRRRKAEAFPYCSNLTGPALLPSRESRSPGSGCETPALDEKQGSGGTVDGPRRVAKATGLDPERDPGPLAAEEVADLQFAPRRSPSAGVVDQLPALGHLRLDLVKYELRGRASWASSEVE